MSETTKLDALQAGMSAATMFPGNAAWRVLATRRVTLCCYYVLPLV